MPWHEGLTHPSTRTLRDEPAQRRLCQTLGRDAQRPSPSFFQSGAEKIKMFKFKVKYTDKDGNPVEIEISVGMSSLSNAAAAAKIGISASKIISIKKL